MRVVASGVNPADPLILSGKYADAFGTRLPLVLGYDAAGVVVETGANVSRLKVGDRVYAYLLMGGGWAEYCLTNEREAALMPARVTCTDAAAVPLAALTAWQALVETAKIEAGQSVLIHGGSGGVGLFAIQIAKARGARVIATASTANQEIMRQLGADVAIDYTAAKFEEVVRDVDVVLDCVGRDTLARSYAVVKPGGIVVTLVARCDPAELEKRQIRGESLASHPNADQLAEITKLIDSGKIKPVVTQAFRLADAAKATQQAATHHTRGKIVLQISDEPKR